VRSCLALFLPILFVAPLLCGQSGRSPRPDDETAIRQVFSRFSTIWDQPGMPGFAELFSEDADFVVISGKWLKGRSEIVSYHKKLLETLYTGSRSIPMEAASIRFLTPDIAVAHVTSGAHYTQDGKEQTRTALATAVLVKFDGVWRITAFHNTLTSGPGYSFGTPATQTAPRTETDHHLVDCPESPTPGKRPSGSGCAIIARKTFNALPKEPIVLRVENYPTVASAEKGATETGAVVEAGGKVWLLTVASRGERSPGGQFVTEIGPLTEIPPGKTYEMQIADADFSPAMNAAISKAVHTHSGPEIWYVLTGQQCLETPDGVTRARAGEGMFARANVPMQLHISGDTNREALFAIVHDAAQPATTMSSWSPSGLCEQR
jgi:uncharacterized protein (TIGR02246 family)